MFCHRLISPLVQPLTPDTRAGDALVRMEDARVTLLPVVEEDRFLGLVSEALLLDADAGSPLSSLQTRFLPYQVRPSDLFTTAVRLMVSTHSDLVAVVGPQGVYEGAVTRDLLFRDVVEYGGMSGEGSILVLEMEKAFYSPGEICRIAEANDALLTQLNTHGEPDSPVLTVLLRFNREEVSDVTASFRRHGYTVLHQQGQDVERDELISNLENLMNYLNV